MTSPRLDFTPRPGAAPALARTLAHARMEVTLTLRNGEQALLALVIPVAVLVAAFLAGPRLGIDPAVTAPSVVGLALWSTGFTSLAIMTAFERRYGVLERLASTPLGKGGLLAGKSLAVATIAGGQVALLALVAIALGWRPTVTPLAVAAALLAAGLALACFSALGLLLAARLRAEATLGLANLVYLAGLAAGLLVPVAAFPAALQGALSWLPTAALGEAFRAAAGGQADGRSLVILALWAVLAVLLARKGFRWTS